MNSTPPSEPTPESSTPSQPQKPDWDPSTRNWIVALHLSALLGLVVPYIGNILGPFLVWTLKKEQFPALDGIGKHVINFQISFTIVAVICSLLIWVCVGAILLPILAVAWLIFVVMGAIKAGNGEDFHYPLTYAFLK